jgi:hypothetical protein
MLASMIGLMLILAVVLLGIAGTQNGPSNSGTVANANNGMQMAFARTQTVTAFNLAESGVEYTLQWLHEQPSPPSQQVAFGPSLWTGTTAPDRTTLTVYNAANAPIGTFGVKIYPDAGNMTNTQKKYVIESIGTSGSFSEILRVYVQQASFSKYSYFTNTEWSNGFWVAGMNSFDGPMHSNSVDVYNRSNPNPIPTNILWYDNGTTAPMFTYDGPDAFSCVAPTIDWLRDNLGNPSGPQNESEWLAVATGGSASVSTGTDLVPLPTSSTTQQLAAIGSSAPPTNIGVTIPNNGTQATAGVYIHGTVKNMVLTTPAPTTQQVEVDQTQSNGEPLVTTVAMNLATNTTTVTVNTTQTDGSVVTTTNSYNGTTNGVVYSDSTIGSNGPPGQGLSGTVANNLTDGNGNIIRPNMLTIATDASQNLYMNGSVTLLTQRQQGSNGAPIPESQDANYVQNAGTCGIVSNHIVVDDTTAANVMLCNEQVDASVMAYDTFDPNNYGYNGALRGTFTINGGYVADTGGCFGEIDWNGNMIEGFQEHYRYDERLANSPPPFFPTTGAQYDVLSWQRVPGTIQ